MSCFLEPLPDGCGGIFPNQYFWSVAESAWPGNARLSRSKNMETSVRIIFCRRWTAFVVFGGFFFSNAHDNGDRGSFDERAGHEETGWCLHGLPSIALEMRGTDITMMFLCLSTAVLHRADTTPSTANQQTTRALCFVSVG